MNLFYKVIKVGISICLVKAAYADSCSTPCPKEDCSTPSSAAPCAAKPCPPQPCAKPCPPVCFEPGYPTDPKCTPCAYNLAAEYELGPCLWDFWFDGSFTYWQASHDGMDLAVSTYMNLNPLVGPGVFVSAPENGRILFQDTQFKPGFKVGLGLGLDHDHWSGLLEYTYFRSTTTRGSDAPLDNNIPTLVTENASVWAGTIISGGLISTHIYSKWRCNIDMLDALLTRPYYQGTHLIIAPFGGIKGQKIRESFSTTQQAIAILELPNSPITFDPANNSPIPVTTNINSNSWGVGPKVGFQGEWHLGWGFRLEGDASASLLYTRYTKVSTSMTSDSPFFSALKTGTGRSTVSTKFTNYNALRAVSELNLGMGWGTYLFCRNIHLDFLVTYDFQIFWNQNMASSAADATYGTGFQVGAFTPGNLYLQGLTARAQFDF